MLIQYSIKCGLRVLGLTSATRRAFTHLMIPGCQYQSTNENYSSMILCLSLVLGTNSIDFTFTNDLCSGNFDLYIHTCSG